MKFVDNPKVENNIKEPNRKTGEAWYMESPINIINACTEAVCSISENEVITDPTTPSIKTWFLISCREPAYRHYNGFHIIYDGDEYHRVKGQYKGAKKGTVWRVVQDCSRPTLLSTFDKKLIDESIKSYLGI